MQMGEKPIVQYQITGTPKPLANPTECHAAWENQHCLWPKKWRLVEDFTACYNSLVEIPGIAICLAERRNMVLRCFQDGFLGHVHKYLGFLVTDPVDMLR
jgi:hypothetical protein